MRNKAAHILFAGWTFLTWTSFETAARGVNGWTPEETLTIVSVGDVQPSPDGRRVIFSVKRPVITPVKSEFITHLYLANADGSSAFQFTFGDYSCLNPQWSPDGSWIAFASNRSGKTELWRIRADGGEAEQLTDISPGVVAGSSPYTAVSRFKWSPDGKWIAFIMPDPPTEAEQRARQEKNDPLVVDADRKLDRLWIVPVEADANGKREVHPIVRMDRDVGSAVFWHYSFGGGFDWSPDGKSIVFSHSATSSPDDWPSSDISVVDVKTRKIRPLVHTMAGEIAPFYSPDGRWIAYLAADRTYTWNLTFTVRVVAASGGESRALAETFDGEPRQLAWSADNRRLYFTETRGTTTRFSALPRDGSAPVDIDDGRMIIDGLDFNRSRSMVGFMGQTTTDPPEAYVTRVDEFRPIPVSHVNRKYPARPLPDRKVVHWRSSDGRQIEGLLTYPSGYIAGKRYPLLLDIHGGPTGAFTETFVANPGIDSTVVFAARGYAVLQCNVRGSSGYGKAFRYANHKDWGGMDYQDLMAGVKYAVQEGVADPARLGVMGWSYGGFLSSWVITQTKQFKAAVVGAGITDLVSFTGTTDIPSFLPGHFGVEFWQDENFYRTRSAVFQVQNISTPTLILHGEPDQRVPVSQGYELYRLLKRRGVATQMVVYPRTPHGPQEPKLLLDILHRTLSWFDRYLEAPES